VRKPISELLNKNQARARAALLLHSRSGAGSAWPAGAQHAYFFAAVPTGEFVQRVVRACLLLTALIISLPGWTAGLGRLTVTSAVGQPFQAEIELVAVKNEQKPELTASLASQQLFRQANVEYSPLLATFEASIEIGSSGKPYVRIASSQPVSQPLINLLVELNWASGRLVREYAVVASPANDEPKPARQSARTSPPVPAPSELFLGKIPRIDPLELVRVLVTDAATELNSLKQTVIGKIRSTSAGGPVSSKEKEVPQLSTGMEPAHPPGEANAGTSGSVQGNVRDSGRYVSLHAIEGSTDNISPARKGSIEEGNESSTRTEQNSEDAHRLLELKNPDLPDVQKQAEALAGGRNGIPPLAAAPRSSRSALSSPMQSETIHSVKVTSATSVYEVTDEPVAVAKPMRPALPSKSPHPEAGSSGGIPGKPTIADQLTLNREFLGVALLLLLAGIVGVSIARRKKGARNPAGEKVASPILKSPPGCKALPATINRETPITSPVEGARITEKVQLDRKGSHVQIEARPPFSGDKPAEGQQSVKMKGRVSFSGSSGDASPPSQTSSPVERSPAGIELKKHLRPANVTRGPLLERGMRWREILSQLDLARAYQEMGDKDAALQVLQEVIRDGDPAQRESAKRILANL
jgi:FimV-like protein